MRITKITILCTILCFVISISGNGQTMNSSCEPIDPSSPNLFLTFVQIERKVPGQDAKKGLAVYKLQNNSTCNVMLIADSPTSLIAIKKSAGGVRFEQSPKLPENTAQNLNYEIVIGKNKKRIRRDMGHIFGLRILPTNKSTLLKIPKYYFEKNSEMEIIIEHWFQGTDDGKKEKAKLLRQKLAT